MAKARNKNEEWYREWAIRNPEVVALFLDRARQRMRTGRRFGMKMLWEVVRWDQPAEIIKTDAWRLNNSHVAYLARDLLLIEPGLRQYIKTRRVEGG